MNDFSAESLAIFADAHELARALISEAKNRSIEGAILEVGTGSGRNERALVAAGFSVVAIADDRPYTQIDAPDGTFGAALATHAYLHGTSAKVRAGFAELARVLAPGAPAFVTLGSVNDVRYGFGEALDAHTFAPGDGSEIGIPHAYFDRESALETVRPFIVESIEEVDADLTVGAWAHSDEELPGKCHWFARLRKREA